jgi:enoyl-CoA hydratase
MAVRSIKEVVLQSSNLDLQAGFEFEHKSSQLLFSTADKTEGMRARRKKGPPKFTGR